MDKKTIIMLAVTATSVAAGIYCYNKMRNAEGAAEILGNQLTDAKERIDVLEETVEAMEADRSRMLNVVQTYKNEKDAAVESMRDMYDAAKEDNIFDYYEKHIKGTPIENRMETKYDIDKRECAEAIEEEKEQFDNEYRQMVKGILDEEGIEVNEEDIPHISYGGHDLKAEEEKSNWVMPALDEIDNTPEWHVEPHQPDKNGRVAPYEISNTTFTQDQDYRKMAVFYYPMMERLEDEEGGKVEIDKSISWMALTWFGSDPEDPNRIYVRNQELKTDYEVIQID